MRVKKRVKRAVRKGIKRAKSATPEGSVPMKLPTRTFCEALLANLKPSLTFPETTLPSIQLNRASACMTTPAIQESSHEPLPSARVPETSVPM